jgi:hypothetical protein
MCLADTVASVLWRIYYNDLGGRGGGMNSGGLSTPRALIPRDTLQYANRYSILIMS